MRTLKDHIVAVLLGKEIGMFAKSYFFAIIRIWDMTEGQLCKFIAALKKLDPALKNQGGASLENLLKKASDWNHSQPELKPPI